MATVLVTDGEQRAALAVVRSLHAAGHVVYVCSSRSRSLAGASRGCRREAAVPDALSSPSDFVDAVQALVRSWGIEVLLPISEAALAALLPERERFAGVEIPFTSHRCFQQICDKATVMMAAARVGIRVPEQRVLNSPDAATALLPDSLRFPLVIKPARSVVDVGEQRMKSAVVHVDGPAALTTALAGADPALYPLLLQERVVGPGVGVFLLIADGRVRASFAHRRLREKPISGGVSVYRESTVLPADLLERSFALLREFGWEGVAMVEYKLDADTGTPYIMEINGRFWGSLQLAIDAGIDFPRLLVESDAPAPPPGAYRLGVRSRWEWGDVDHLLARLRRSPQQLSLPPGSPGRGRAVLDFLRALGPGSRAEVFRFSDPAPFLRESIDWLRGG